MFFLIIESDYKICEEEWRGLIAYWSSKIWNKVKMMYTILLPIHPDHVKNIFNGTKRYEFRKRICKKTVDRILIYSTSPVMKVMGEAEIEDILVDTPEIIWERTKEKAGIDKRFFDRYYAGRNQAVAYKLKNITEYEMPKELKDYGISRAPQSFQYVK